MRVALRVYGSLAIQGGRRIFNTPLPRGVDSWQQAEEEIQNLYGPRRLVWSTNDKSERHYHVGEHEEYIVVGVEEAP